uniref:Dof-type domain-containing protein n=1 Tax=Nelumbo nucifera TaxID=4432 RepID=A0A822Z099_NELNU|nr:TPA_asm: hypothetical protein HUJ06_005538 [Nelumbo nucifera]
MHDVPVEGLRSSEFGDPSGGKPTKPTGEDGGPPTSLKKLSDPATSLEMIDEPQTASVEKEAATTKGCKTEEEQNETTTSIPQEKTLKKPDKILPCPRCNSMDTKFCYFNNYNVNQPRHFCKNCQRYWTAGGTMRNVPVGAGRRKNKNSASHYRHITVSEALQTTRTDAPDGVHHSALKPNGTLLTFSSDSPLCESMASMLNLTEKTIRNCTRNGFNRAEEQRIPVSCGVENGDDRSSGCGSSITSSNCTEDGNRVSLQDPMMRNCNGFPPQIPCFPGTPWPYPWNSAQWSSAVPPPPAFCPSSFPVSFYPTATYWGCTLPANWNIPWISPPSSSSSNGGSGSGPNSPLGKHSRDGSILKSNNKEKADPSKESNSEKCLWIPKTLRIDDPGEAARSSIWSTLGIKNNKADSISAGGLFKVFQPKSEEKNHTAGASLVLQANPAALSRSLNFHETS